LTTKRTSEFWGKSLWKSARTKSWKIIKDDVAWPDTAKPEFKVGVKNWFNLVQEFCCNWRFLNRGRLEIHGLRKGIKANVWDGVPQEVMAKPWRFICREHTYPFYLKPEECQSVAEWDAMETLT